jgi:hypothetical protein
MTSSHRAPRPRRSPRGMLYDVFICHASEDKESFVRPLAERLREENVAVWYDEFSLRLGDSLRQSIDKGLGQSRFGIVVLSKAFFAKKWPQYELDGLVEREMRGEDRVLLPVWHGVSRRNVARYAPSLAGRKAALSSSGEHKVVTEILGVIRPQGSPLIEARDILLGRGVVPPVITDEYWLDVVEASNRLPGYGAAIPNECTWDTWSFPLPSSSRGERLAWTALQMRWTAAAERDSVTLLSPPGKVHDFIDANPGLAEACRDSPDLVVEYAPQLAIPGFEGNLMLPLEQAYQKSCSQHVAVGGGNSTSGSALTTDGGSPLCDEEWAIRHPTFGNHKPAHVAEAYFNGGMFGPRVSPYEHADHLFWLLSSASKWLPSRVHAVLLEGMSSWHAWVWMHGGHPKTDIGALQTALWSACEGKNDFEFTPAVQKDILERIRHSVSVLGLRDKPRRIYDAFVEYDMPGKYVALMKRIREQQKRPRNSADGK